MISSNTYEEVYQVLKHMNKISVMKIPEKLLKNIVNNRNPNFETKIKKEDLFNQDNISTEAKDFLCWITYNYWMDEAEKERIKKINYDFYAKEEERKKEKYSNEILFPNNIKDAKVYSNKAVPMVIEERGIFKRIINKIKSFFKFWRA